MIARTALITGVLGQDGSLLAELLLQRGLRVMGVVREGSRLPFSGPLATVQFMSVDLSDAEAVKHLLAEQRPSEVYHLAAFHHSSQEGSSGAALAARDAMCRINFWAVKNLALALLELDMRSTFVFASSSQIFTAESAIHPIDEASAHRPSTFYGHTKSWSMDLLSFLRREHGLCASSAILFNHESTRRGDNFVTRKITKAAAHAARGGTPKLRLQNIGARVDWSSAHDVVDALSRMAGTASPQDYVVASGTLHSVRDVLDVAFAHVGLDWKAFVDFGTDQEVPTLLGCPAAIERDLGWRRRVPFRAMLEEMVDSDLASTSPSQA